MKLVYDYDTTESSSNNVTISCDSYSNPKPLCLKGKDDDINCQITIKLRIFNCN